MDNTRVYKKGASGFTFVELLVALVVAGILLAIGAPSMNSVIQDRRLQSAIGPVSLAATIARSESTKAGGKVTVCARANDTQCGNDWNNGLLVFRDTTVVAGETQAVRDAGDEILRIVSPHGSDITINAVASTDRTAAGAFTPSFVRFRPDGRSNWKNGTFYVCDSRGSLHARALHITISGDVRAARRLNADTASKDVFGRALSCT